MENEIKRAEERLEDAVRELDKAFSAAKADLRTVGKQIPAQFHKDRKYLETKINWMAARFDVYKDKYTAGTLNNFERRRFKRLNSDISFLHMIQLCWIIKQLDNFVESSEESNDLTALERVKSEFSRKLNKFPEI